MQTILLIEDSSFNKECLLDSIGSINVIINQASNVADALLSLKEACPDIIMMDARQGQVMLSFLEESCPETIVILLAETTDDHYPKKGAHFLFGKSQKDQIRETVIQLVN